MVMVMQACKLNLPHLRPSLEVTSLLFEPSSKTLALMHSDSSVFLLPSLSPFSPSPSPSTQTLIPPFSTSSCFLRLQSTPNSPTTRILFLVAGPRHADSRVFLRFWILQKTSLFVKTKVITTQKCFSCDDKSGVFVDLSHGTSVKLAGAVNVFALHSPSARKIWVFSAKMIGDEESSICIKLMKCAVIDCTTPICSIVISMGFMILGEANGVRVFPLGPIFKGRMKKQRNLNSVKEIEKKKSVSPQNHVAWSGNGVCRLFRGSNDKNCSSVGHSENVDNGNAGKTAVLPLQDSAEISSGGKAVINTVPSKLKTVKLKQDSTIGGTFFLEFNSQVTCQKSSTKPPTSLKASSIHSLSQKKFLVVDSNGDLHVLDLSGKMPGSETAGHMERLSHTMRVQMLAVLPDFSTRTQTFWISDGFNSVHVMSISDMEVSFDENDAKESEEKKMQISAIQAMFASEKVQDVAPLSANAVLILGQGNIFAYAIS